MVDASESQIRLWDCYFLRYCRRYEFQRVGIPPPPHLPFFPLLTPRMAADVRGWIRRVGEDYESSENDANGGMRPSNLLWWTVLSPSGIISCSEQLLTLRENNDAMTESSLATIQTFQRELQLLQKELSVVRKERCVEVHFLLVCSFLTI